jgi:transposase
MAWGAIGWDFKSPLVILEKENGQRGIGMRAYANQVLERHLGPLFLRAQEDDPCVFIIEDNAPIHGKRGAGSLCNRIWIEMDLHSIDWPPSSPDMNIIENVWRLIKQRLRNRKVHGTWTLSKL